MTVDLSKLAAPEAVKTVDYQAIFDHMLADLKRRDSSLNPTEADPLWKLLQVAAYREAILRQELNDRARGLLLAYATGSDLDHLGVTYFKTERIVLQDADNSVVPPLPEIKESDEKYRARLLMAEDGYSTAGPIDAYVFHAKSAHGAVKDVSVETPAVGSGQVVVTVLWEGVTTDPESGDLVSYTDEEGQLITELDPPETGVLTHLDVMDAVGVQLEKVRPLTDHVTVQPAAIIEYTVNAIVELYADVDGATVMEEARKSLEAWVDAQHRIGREITVSGLHAALTVEGVHEVVLRSIDPTDITNSQSFTAYEAPFCSGITLELA